ncbi:MAG: hypothetical protein ABIP53_08070 [Candidatus Limnocylindrales bacterium]
MNVVEPTITITLFTRRAWSETWTSCVTPWIVNLPFASGWLWIERMVAEGFLRVEIGRHSGATRAPLGRQSANQCPQEALGRFTASSNLVRVEYRS